MALIDLSNLSEPVNTFIKEVSKGIGVLYEPTRIRREGRALADVAKIDAQTKLEISELEKRTVLRVLKEETRKQINMENIADKAVFQIEETASPQDVKEDWYTHFFNRARDTSDEEMQDLWAKILAGEANRPGSYSRRLLDILSIISSENAAKFEAMMPFVFSLGANLIPLIFDHNDEYYKKKGINLSHLLQLTSLGLISTDTGSQSVFGLNFPKAMNNEKKLVLQYFEDKIEITENPSFHNTPQNTVSTGRVLFTEEGLQLAKLVGGTKEVIPDLLTYVKFHIEKTGEFLVNIQSPSNQ